MYHKSLASSCPARDGWWASLGTSPLVAPHGLCFQAPCRLKSGVFPGQDALSLLLRMPRVRALLGFPETLIHAPHTWATL